MESCGKVTVGNNTYEITQKTAYPENGKIAITVSGGDVRLAVRIPAWCESYQGKSENGYAYFDAQNGEEITLDLEMKPTFIYANPEVVADLGKCALMRGPVVYCMEGCDNPSHLRGIVVDTEGDIERGFNSTLGVDTLTCDCTYPQSFDSLYTSKKPATLCGKATFIPYYAFANRGRCEMQVWCQYK